MGANEVIVIDGHESRLELAKNAVQAKQSIFLKLNLPKKELIVFLITQMELVRILLEVVGFQQ